ncbi:MAG: DNA polymerase IV [Clostridia bacterium]|nr:DNA polymerase IV [Clostridia bacterium]
MNRLVFHVDVNSAYLSWEAARRVKEGGEDIRLIPSAIGGDPQRRTGVILAKSIPAKKYGVKTGEPVGMALRKCPELFLAKPDFRLYEQNSRAFISICEEYAPVVEQVSIDECFLDMSGTQRIYPDPYHIAQTIKDTIRDRLGFTVNVGISVNKLLAKMASDFEKPDKIHTLFPNEIEEKMWPLPIGELYTVGASTAEKLKRERIMTIGDLAKADVNRIKAILGSKQGQHIHQYANGIDDTPVLTEPEEAKGYSNSTTLSKDVVTAESAYKILLALADSVAARMRMDNAKAYCVSVTIRDNAFKNHSHQRSLKEATDVTNEIYALCRQLFDELWDKKTPLRLLGVALTDIDRTGGSQLSFFEDPQKERQRKLDKAADAIRGRFGSGALIRASTYDPNINVGKKHKAQADLKSLEQAEEKGQEED